MLLTDIIVNRIKAKCDRAITFAEFMELALYHSQYGYYTTKAVDIGAQGDFFTSPHLGKDFGELLAVQFAQMWDIMGQPVPFTLVEMGAGQGILAVDILKYLYKHYREFFNALQYVIVEVSPGLKQQQQQLLQGVADKVKWCSLEEIPANSIIGCFFSNELVDAMPINLFSLQDGKLGEIYITLAEDDSFIEVCNAPSTPKIAEYFDLVGVNLAQLAGNYRSEINLAALEWLSTISQKLQQGYLLTIDYGYTAARYYNPMRSQGTLQCYYRHQYHNNPYINIGEQDITAHVDFTALDLWGDRCGLQKVGFTQQGLFLMALGLGERIAAISTDNANNLSQLLQRRETLHQLINPQGLGGFGVLVQSKGLLPSIPLTGLTA
ncbi:class I SAM-dependent methyltransferase [Synechocystis sp. PCC 7509]|uniref:class I SAM-dependent methyltransferase n=1 Tax=Synechocystis sp. PCC 7509 TaxID=927677 RepID=UPI0002AC7017|nr:class I SAM-dependent methyltransferase [Synechocystis sp. PCC 7509]